MAVDADLTDWPPLARRAVPYGQIIVGTVVAALVAVLPPTLAFALLGAIGLGAVLLARPLIALYLLVFSIPYGSVRDLQAGGLNITLTQVLVFCGGAAVLMQAAIAGRLRIRWDAWRRPLLLFMLALILSTTQATDLKLSIKELLKLGEWLLTYLLVLSYVDTPARLRRVLLLLVLAALSQGLLGLAQTVAHAGPTSFVRAGALRASGTFDQPNPFAGFLNFTLPLVLAGSITGVRVVGRLTRPAIVILGAALLASGSRGALLALIAAGAVMALVHAPRTRILLGLGGATLVGVVAGALIGVVPVSITTAVLDVFGVSNIDVANPTPRDWPTAERLAHQLAGLRMFADHPLLGVGIGNYPAAYARYQVAPVWANNLGHAHNYYINVAAEAGVVGLGAFVLVLVSAFVIVTRLYRRAADPVARTLALGVLGVLTTVAVHSFFDNMFVHEMEAQLALVIGMVTVTCRLSVERGGAESQREARPETAARPSIIDE